MKPNTSHNPNGLTDRQVEVMDALITCGCSKQVAADLGVRYTVVDQIARAALRKIGARNRTMALLEWDRMRREPAVIDLSQTANSVFGLGAAK